VEQSNSYTIEFLVDAINDMSEIISSFVMLGSKQGAVRIKNKMNKAVQQISDFPYLGVTIPDDIHRVESTLHALNACKI